MMGFGRFESSQLVAICSDAHGVLRPGEIGAAGCDVSVAGACFVGAHPERIQGSSFLMKPKTHRLAGD